MEDLDDNTTIEFSDRTAYSAYAERCSTKTKCSNGDPELKSRIGNMCFREFVETMNFTWKKNKDTILSDNKSISQEKVQNKRYSFWLLDSILQTQKEAHSMEHSLVHQSCNRL